MTMLLKAGLGPTPFTQSCPSPDWELRAEQHAEGPLKVLSTLASWLCSPSILSPVRRGLGTSGLVCCDLHACHSTCSSPCVVCHLKLQESVSLTDVCSMKRSMNQNQTKPQLKEHREILLSSPEIPEHRAEGHLSSIQHLPFKTLIVKSSYMYIL